MIMLGILYVDMDQKTLQKTLVILIVLIGLVASGSSLHLPLPRGNSKCRCIRGTTECHMEVIELSMAAAYSKGIRSCMPGSRLCCSRDVTGTFSQDVVADTDGALMMKIPHNFRQRQQQKGFLDPQKIQDAEDAGVPEKEEAEIKTESEIGVSNTSEGESSTVYEVVATTPQDTDSVDTGHLLEEYEDMMIANVKESVPSGARINFSSSDNVIGSAGDAEFTEDREILVSSPDASESLNDSTGDRFTTDVPQATTESTTEAVEENSQRPKLIPGSSASDGMDATGSQEAQEGYVGVGNTTSGYKSDGEDVTEEPLPQKESNQSLGSFPESKLSENEVIYETRNGIEISTQKENVLPTPPTYTTPSLRDTIEEPETGPFPFVVTPSLLEEDLSSSPMPEPKADAVPVTEASVPIVGVKKQEADQIHRDSESVTTPGGEPLDTLGNTVLCSRLSCNLDAEVYFGVPRGTSSQSETTAEREGAATNMNRDLGEGVTEFAPFYYEHVSRRPVTHRTLPPLHLNSEEELKAFLKSLENLPKGGTSTDVKLAIRNRNQGKSGTFLSWLWG